MVGGCEVGSCTHGGWSVAQLKLGCGGEVGQGVGVWVWGASGGFGVQGRATAPASTADVWARRKLCAGGRAARPAPDRRDMLASAVVG